MDQTLLLVPLDDTVVFPTMDVTLPVDVAGEDRVLLVPRHDGEFAKVGTIATSARSSGCPAAARGASLEGVARGVIVGAAQTDARGRLRVAVEEHADDVPANGRTRELETRLPRGRRGDPRAARRRRPRRGVPARRSSTPARSRTRPATPPT